MAWTLVSGQVASAEDLVGGTNTLSVSLPNTPVAGNMIAFAGVFFNGAGGGGTASMTVVDGSGNTFRTTPNSPSTYDGTAGQAFLAYYNVRNNGRVSKSFTATFATNQTVAAVWVAEFAGGWGTLDGDNKGVGTGTNVNTPTVTVSHPNELLYMGIAYQGTLSSVDAPWTAVDIVHLGCWSGYDLSASVNTALAATGPLSRNWSSSGMSLTLSPYISVQPLPQNVYAGQTATFNITATTSGGTLHYQWKDDGANVGTDSSSYTTGATVPGDNGSLITCVVTDDNGSFTSDTTYLNVMGSGSLAWRKA